MHAKDALGKSGEQAAAEYLESSGLRILDRNWRCATGEIDIVAVDRQTLVVAEVKARTSTRYGTPIEAVSRAKRARLRRLAVQWLNAHGVRFRPGPHRRGRPGVRRHRRVLRRAHPGSGVACRWPARTRWP